MARPSENQGVCGQGWEERGFRNEAWALALAHTHELCDCGHVTYLSKHWLFHLQNTD